ncbi:hypothetical protein L5515_015268 [Caenorhabditis briggsae]|uniref:Nuclear receptor domain-containing protein n=1 Tax=Caenorhabditis briggsae TaxID=6238 RepID=A0AAE9EDP0_CAEBR|nr:hypothetical protein L3Y34_019139 [Caenorhabditis briggsae]UMM19826.1 hypothetical protein L5515_015268 [Caenorhabditis briggsae]
MPEDICRVCGANAEKYNYGVISCNSCRNFFTNYQEEFLKKCRELYLLDKTRPIVLDQDDRKIMMKIRCTYYGDCDINVITRRKCDGCRLKKCLDVGMKLKTKSEVNEEDDRLKREKNYFVSLEMLENVVREQDELPALSQEILSLHQKLMDEQSKSSQTGSFPSPSSSSFGSQINPIHPIYDQLVGSLQLEIPTESGFR